MISRVSFNGQVHLVGAMQQYSESSEIKEMRRYANDNDCDVVVLSKKENKDGTGCYDVMVSTTNKSSGTNDIKKDIFDFFKKDGKLNDTKKSVPVPSTYESNDNSDYMDSWLYLQAHVG